MRHRLYFFKVCLMSFKLIGFTILSRLTISTGFAKNFIVESSHIYFFGWSPLILYIYLKKPLFFETHLFFAKGLPLLITYIIFWINRQIDSNFSWIGITYLFGLGLFILSELSDDYIKIILKNIEIDRTNKIFHTDYKKNLIRKEIWNIKTLS